MPESLSTPLLKIQYGGASGTGEGGLTPPQGDDARGGKGSDPDPARGTQGTCEWAARTVRRVLSGHGAARGGRGWSPGETWGPGEPPRWTPSRAAQSRENNTDFIMGDRGELGSFQEYISPSEKSVTLTALVESHLSVAC